MEYLKKFTQTRIATAVREAAEEAGFTHYRSCDAMSYEQEPGSWFGQAHHGYGRFTNIKGKIQRDGSIEVSYYDWLEWGRD